MRLIKAISLLFFLWILHFSLSARTFTYSDSCAGNDGKFTIDDITGITTVLWNFGDPSSGALNTSTLVSPIHSFTNNGDFNVKLTINGTEVVNVPIHISFKFTGSSSVGYFCKGTTITLDPDTSKKANRYLWVTGETTQRITINFYKDTTFYAWMYDIHECRARSIFNLKVLSLSANFTIDKPNQCLSGNIFEFTNTTITSKRPWLKYKWLFGDGNSVNSIKDTNHIYSSAGAFSVRLIVTPFSSVRDSFECADTISKPVNVFNQVIPDFDFDVNRCENLVTFNNTSGPAQNYFWDFGNGKKYFVTDTTEKYPGTGKYTVKLFTNIGTSCIDSISKDIEITLADSMIFIPNAFSPNNDNLNDSFKVYGLDYECFTYKLLIYDRWGELIYTSENKLGEPYWDGKCKSKRVPQGVYYYSIIGKHFTKWGALTVLP